MSESSTPIEDRGYAHPEYLASTEWLASHIDDSDVRVVDCNFPGEFEDGHIPGAAQPENNWYKGSSASTLIAPPDEFERMMSVLGISNDSTVVAYDSDSNHLAPRLFWALRYYGHANVKVLDGGYPAWLAENRTVETGAASVEAGSFKASTHAEVIALREDILADIGATGTQFWDVRTDEEWTGENARGTARGGRIPGATHLEWKTLITGGDVPVFRSSDELMSILTSVGVTLDKNIVPY
ncbi:MAG: sulfurtransferase [Chloroflexi bacterium]|nr:sulfurtransferase [Chloroflexota bacterium]